ncbi:MAG: hypothetical protein ABSG87_04985, partial [Verrucomicrobiota bacterium]
EFPASWEAEHYKWRQTTWAFLNSNNNYHTPWLKFKDMEMIVEKWQLKDLLHQKLFDKFRSQFLEIINVHFPEIAEKERSRRNQVA